MQTITVQQLAAEDTRHPVNLIDVRTRSEFYQGHAKPAKNIPLNELGPQDLLSICGEAYSDRPVYLICKSGSRSAQAVQKLLAAGCSNVFDVTGGTDAWQAAQLPMEEHEQTMSLERQIRIAAGILTLTGTSLAILVHPYYIGIALFTGAGLIFAGVTDLCGIGVLLAKMPWNRGPDHSKKI